MVAVVFVHGISIRSAEYEQSLGTIKSALESETRDVTVVPCFWGGDFGAKLSSGGLSIPKYEQTKGSLEHFAAISDVQRWLLLADDPLVELQILSLRPRVSSAGFDPRQATQPADLLDSRIRSLVPSKQLSTLLGDAGFPSSLVRGAIDDTINSSYFRRALASCADDPGVLRAAFARSVIAFAWQQTGAAEGTWLDIVKLTELSTSLAAEIGDQEKGLGGEWLGQMLSIAATRFVRKRRGRFTDAIVPFVGDTLVYQGNGGRIRRLIAETVANAGVDSPVVLLGHSLGGVACVDLLCETAFPAVPLVITVGSQAPLFYELDALQSLRFGNSLPAHFPPWLNIYDEQDFLSYVGEAVFDDPRRRIEDVRVDNRRSFPSAHSAYWTNPGVWEIVISRLGELPR